DRCLECRACDAACPSGVEYGKLVEGARSQLELARKRGPLARLARTVGFRVILPRPAVLAGFVRFSAIARRLGAARVLRILGFGRLGDLLALVPTRVSSQPLPRSFAAIGARRGRVALFTGCVMRAAFSDTNAATARVLARSASRRACVTRPSTSPRSAWSRVRVRCACARRTTIPATSSTPEDQGPAARAPACDPRARAAAARRGGYVLRQRWHVQRDPAGALKSAA